MVTAAVTFQSVIATRSYLETKISPCAAKADAIGAKYALVFALPSVPAPLFSFRLSGPS
jgi:hypothetical protein